MVTAVVPPHKGSEMVWACFTYNLMYQLGHEYGLSNLQRMTEAKEDETEDDTWSECFRADMRACRHGGINPQKREAVGFLPVHPASFTHNFCLWDAKFIFQRVLGCNGIADLYKCKIVFWTYKNAVGTH